MSRNEWLDKAMELLDHRLVSRGFNVLDQWLGYYDEYCLHFIPNPHYEDGSGTVEIHSKEEVFNPYKYCGGKGIEYEKLGEFSMYYRQWETLRGHIIGNDYKVGNKNVCFDNPYPTPRPQFIDGSDVPISGYYE